MKTTLTLVAFCAALSAPLVALAQSDAGAEIVAHDASQPAVAADSGVAAPAPAPEAADPVGLAGELYSRLQSGEWLGAFGVGLVLLVFGLRRFAGKLSGWFNGKAGGYVLSFGTAVAMTFGTAIMAGEPVSFGLLTLALSAAWIASGQFDGLRDFLGWLRKKLG